jgi:branched-chain amino acid transport system substrate-binding protein
MLSLLRITVAAILLAAASGASAADKTGVTATTIKIGLFGPLSAPAGSAKKNVYGAAAIYKDINDKGGINGRKIELVIEDDACDGAKGIAAYNKLREQDKVFLVHGGWCSKVALAVKPEAAKHPGVPYMVLGAASAEITANFLPNVYQPVATSLVAGGKMVDFALSKPGAKRIAIIGHTDEWGSAYRAATIGKLKEHKLAPVVVATLERGQKDAAEQVKAIKEAAPDAVLALLYQEEMEVYLREAYKQGLKVTTVGATAASIDDTNKRIGIPEAMNDVYMCFPLRGTLTSPELRNFANIFRKYYPAEALDSMSFYSMDGAIVVVEVLKRLGRDVTRERFMAEINKVKNFAGGVQPGTITYTPKDHRGMKFMNLIGLVRQREVIFQEYPAAPH